MNPSMWIFPVETRLSLENLRLAHELGVEPSQAPAGELSRCAWDRSV